MRTEYTDKLFMWRRAESHFEDTSVGRRARGQVRRAITRAAKTSPNAIITVTTTDRHVAMDILRALGAARELKYRAGLARPGIWYAEPGNPRVYAPVRARV